MAVTLVVEDGTVVDGANTFVELDVATAYAEAHLGASAWVALTEDQQNASLVQSARLLGQKLTWVGEKTDQTQPLCWPRIYATNEDGYEIASDEIPQQVKDAQCELAIQLASTDYVADSSAATIREKVDVIEVEYSESTARRRASLPDVVIDILYPLATKKSTSGFAIAKRA